MRWNNTGNQMGLSFIFAVLLALIAVVIVSSLRGVSPAIPLIFSVGFVVVFLGYAHVRTNKARNDNQNIEESIGKEKLRLEKNARLRERSEIFNNFIGFWKGVSFIVIFFSLVVFVFKYFDPLESEFFYRFILIAPQLMIMPLFLFMWMFIWYGSLTLPGFLRARLIVPGDAQFGVLFSDVKAQPNAVEDARRQINLLENWSKAKTNKKNPGALGVVFSLLFFWLVIPAVLIVSLFSREAAQTLAQISMRPQHMIFYGPPGTGKTFLAIAIATVSNLPVLLLPATVMHQPFLGVGVILWNLIQFFKIMLPAIKYGGIVVAIDEIDAFAQARSGMSNAVFQSSNLNGSERPPRPLTACGISINDPDFYGIFDEDKAEHYNQSLGVFDVILDVFRAPIPGLFGGGGTEAVLTQLMMMLDGIKSPPMTYQMKKKFVNSFIDGFLGWAFLLFRLPTKVSIGKHTIHFRMPPGIPEEANYLMIGLTNRINMLDPALLRPGRLGLHVRFSNPDHDGIRELLVYYMNKHAHSPELDEERMIEMLAKRMKGSSPVQVKEYVEGAAHLAVEREEAYGRGQPPFSKEDILEAVRNVKYGQELRGYHTPETEADTLVHEGGHLLSAYKFLEEERIEEVMEFSVKARGESAGRVDSVPFDEKSNKSTDRTAYEAKLRVLLAGRVIEEIFFEEQQHGAKADLAAATAVAAYMVGSLKYSPRECSKEDREKYIERGQDLFSLVLAPPFGIVPQIIKVVREEPYYSSVCIFLGQAYVDVYEFLSNNKEAFLEWRERFLALGAKREYIGDEIAEIKSGINLSSLGASVAFPDPPGNRINPFRREKERVSGGGGNDA